MYNPNNINPTLNALEKQRSLQETELSQAEQEFYNTHLIASGKNASLATKRMMSRDMSDMGAFKGIFSDIEIQQNKNKLQEIITSRASEIKDRTQRAEIMEKLIEDTLTSTDVNWFKSETDKEFNCYQTLAYDDWINHTDFVFEWLTKDGKEIRLAVDCTVSSNDQVIKKKLGFVKDEIESKKRLTDIKYFESGLTNRDGKKNKGEMKNIPRIILIISKDKLEDICDLVTGTKNDKLNIHPLQIVLLQDIAEQLQAQLEIIKKWRYTEMNDALKDALNQIQTIIQEKKDFIELSKSNEVKKPGKRFIAGHRPA